MVHCQDINEEYCCCQIELDYEQIQCLKLEEEQLV